MNSPLKHSDKKVFLTSLQKVYYSIQKNHKKFTHKIASEHMKTENLVFYYSKNSFLVDVIDKKLGLIISSGLIDLWIKNSLKTHTWAQNKPKREQRKLNLTHLSGAFYVLVTGYVISVGAFMLESMMTKWATSRQNETRMFDGSL
jgi:hypothetical protein